MNRIRRLLQRFLLRLADAVYLPAPRVTYVERKKHDLPRRHGEYRIGDDNDLPNKVSSQELEDWFAINHKCKNCGKVIRTHEALESECEPETMTEEEYEALADRIGW